MSHTIDIKPLEARIAELDQQIANPAATPPIGTPVVWYRGARVDDQDPSKTQVAAMVTGIEGPGKLKLVTFTPFKNEEHKQGVLHISHPLHANRANSVSVNSGAWDYPDGVRPAKGHYDLHLEVLKIRREEAVKQLEEAKAVKAQQVK